MYFLQLLTVSFYNNVTNSHIQQKKKKGQLMKS